MKKIIIRICAVLVLLVVVALVVVFFSLNSIVKKAVETVGPQLTKVDVKLGSADISPFSGSGKLSKFFVGNPSDYKTPFAIQMDSVKVVVEVGSVFKDTIIVDEVNIQGPEIQFDGGLSGNNLSKILDNIKSASAGSSTPAGTTPAPAANGKQKKIIVKDFVMQGAKIHLNINTGITSPVTSSSTIPDIHLQNVGTAEGGLTPGQLCDQLFQPVYNSTAKLAEGAVTSGLKNIQDLTKGGTSSLTNITSGLGGLLNKK